MAGVWDTEPVAAANAGADLAAPAFDTVADCVAVKPELAYVLGMHAQMPKICRQLIAAGIPFVLEKPGAAAAADLAAVRDEARAAGVPATVALVQRYGPLPDLLTQVGRLRHLRFTFIAGPPSRYTTMGCGWVLDRAVSGGGCLYLLGVHFTDMLRHVTGSEIASSRSAMQYLTGGTVEDYGVVTLETADGTTTATVEIGWTFPDGPVKRYVNYTAAGDGGHVAVDTNGGVELHTPGRQAVQTVDVDSDALYPVFVEAVAANHRTGFAGMPGLADLVKAMQPVEASSCSCDVSRVSMSGDGLSTRSGTEAASPNVGQDHGGTHEAIPAPRSGPSDPTSCPTFRNEALTPRRSSRSWWETGTRRWEQGDAARAGTP